MTAGHLWRLQPASRALQRAVAAAFAVLLSAGLMSGAAAQTLVTLADQPVFSSVNVPGNLALVLSVEYPTAISVANLGSYADASTYLGYFDPAKCYTYLYSATAPTTSYFKPVAFATGSNGHLCTGQWSGNFMNWATMQTIDPFRWALTGGYRSVDTNTQTILEKAWASNQGSASANFPNKGTYEATGPTGNNLPASLVTQVTPLATWSNFELSMWNQGNSMVFASVSTSNGTADWQGPTSNDVNTLWTVHVRVDVCDPTTSLGLMGLEANCVQYGSSYKPQGLMQQYSNQIRFAAIGYPLGYGLQGGILREPMNYIGPTYPQALSPAVVTNSTDPEWSASTGIMSVNPDSTTASGSGVSQSGVMNYLNKFGEAYQSYMTKDDVSVLYYAAIRYFENLGNVPTWMSGVTGSELDGFPAVNTWSDPIAYSCQKNFVLGIGDDHTWDDYNVGGATVNGGIADPAAVSSDTFNQAATWTASLQALEGITQTPWWAHGASNATYYIAGLAYGTHVIDIRPDLTGTQTISTYWMDVAEDQEVENLNPYYLATKYGGFSVPNGYSISNTTALPLSEWDTTGNTILMNGGYTQNQPDNYYEAGYANQMVAGLKSAFSNIASAISAYTTAFSVSNPTIASSGELSFSAQYNSAGWTGTVTANTVTLGSGGVATDTLAWKTDTTLQAQVTGTGWNTNRNIVTWNGSAGVAFRAANLSTAQQAALVPSYSTSLTCSGTAGCKYLNYVRGDQSNEVGVSGGTASLRARTLFLGDIVDSATTPVAAPTMPFSEANNTGYTAFKTTGTAATRPTMVYVGANDGMMHGFLASSGVEQFAYVPSAVIQGPTATPQTNGLAQLGNPKYTHHYYVDATPLAFDVDFGNTYGGSGAPSWHTLLIGGLGKGGMSFYALDVTNPSSMTSESAVAGDVLWEFTDSTMGYSFGAPSAFKTAKYGWVVAVTSGYDGSSTYGYLYLINPRTGALLEKIATPLPSSGLTQATAFTEDYTDDTADSVYVGDLNGQLWRFTLTQPKGTTISYPAPTLFAKLTDSLGNAQAVTSAPLIEIHPTTRQRYVLVGTGQLLSSNDVASTAAEDFYAILDGTDTGFTTATLPITRANLTAETSVTAGVTLSGASQGWYLDLGSSSGVAWRMILSPAAYNGVVAFTDLLTSTNPCAPSGASQLYAVNFATGASVLTNNTTGYITSPTAITNIEFLSQGTGSSSANAGVTLYYGTNGPTPIPVPSNLAGTLATRLLNWREIPTAE